MHSAATDYFSNQTNVKGGIVHNVLRLTEGRILLKETNNVKHIWKELPKNQAQRLHYLPPGPERAKLRSKTFKGIAEAVAEQWAGFIKN